MKHATKQLAVVLAIALLLSLGTTALAASTDASISQREIENAAVSQYIATQGMVLLENNGALPIAKGGPIVLVKGDDGSAGAPSGDASGGASR